MRNFIAILLFSISFSVHASSPHYAIVVDAGSSGSRLHLFQYDEAQPLPVINDIFSENINPGLSSFADQPANAGGSLKKLFDDVTVKIKELHIEQHSVSVNVLATAGMRLLSTEKQQAIYQNIRSYLTSNYQFNVQRVETITGKMEGMYGWLDVNYLANRFDSNSDATYGIIDMGGASSEIAFSTNDKSLAEDEITVNITNKTYTVFSKSILGSGQDKMREAMNQSSDASSCYPTHYQLNDKVTGLFDYNKCSAVYSSLINAFASHIPAAINNEFIAYSGIYYAFHFLDADKVPTKENVISKTKQVCQHTWEELKQDPHYTNVADKYLSSYCANAIYQTNLIFDTYRINDSQLYVQNKLNDKEIDWTLGALLFEVL